MQRRRTRKTRSQKRDVVLERTLELKRKTKVQPLRVRMYRPDPDPLSNHGDWRCVFEVVGLPRRKSFIRAAYGVDPMQAFLMAFQKLRFELMMLQDDGLAITWLGMKDLGIPSTVEHEMSLSEWRRKRSKRQPKL